MAHLVTLLRTSVNGKPGGGREVLGRACSVPAGGEGGLESDGGRRDRDQVWEQEESRPSPRPICRDEGGAGLGRKVKGSSDTRKTETRETLRGTCGADALGLGRP